jgi:hypothetical protein
VSNVTDERIHLVIATALGGEIWADLDSRLDHVGPSVFHGNVASQFASAVAVPTATADAA